MHSRATRTGIIWAAAFARAATLAALGALAFGGQSATSRADTPPTPGEPNDIRLELRPRICTLTMADAECDTTVRATWRSPRDESLCLVIVGRPEVKRCWEHYSQGTYSIELVFSADLVFELEDVAAQKVVASEVLRVIREAIRYRKKRREPWNLFD